MPTLPTLGKINNVIKNDANFFFMDELFSGRTGTGRAADNNREYVRRFLVGVRKKTVTQYAVCRAPGLPLVGTPYTTADGTRTDPLSLAVSLRASPWVEDDWQYWLVEVSYSTKVPPGGISTFHNAADTEDHPELEPPVIAFDNEVMREAPQDDATGRPFWNSAGMPFTPAPTFEVAYPTITVVRNILEWDTVTSASFSYALNDAPLLSYPPGCVQCLPPVASEESRGSLRYYRVRFVLRFKYPRMEPVPPDKTVLTNVPPPDPDVPLPPLPPLDGDGHVLNIPDWVPQEAAVGRLSPVFSNNSGNLRNLPKLADGQRWITWQPRVLDAGLMERRENPRFDPNRVGPFRPGENQPTDVFPIKLKDNQPISQPLPLDGNGRLQTKVNKYGAPIPVYLVFEYYRYTDLSIILKNWRRPQFGAGGQNNPGN